MPSSLSGVSPTTPTAVSLNQAPSNVTGLFSPVGTPAQPATLAYPSALEAARKPYPQLNGFRPWVINELASRKIEYPHSPVAPFVRLTSCKRDPKNQYMFFSLGLHGLEVPIANVSGQPGSSNFDPRNVSSNGLITEAANVNIFDLSYGSGNDIVGYARDLSNPNADGTLPIKMITSAMLGLDTKPNLSTGWTQFVRQQFQQQQQRNQNISNTTFAGGAHPVPGILEVDAHLKGYGLPLQTRVTFKCYNRAQLEFLRNHFMLWGGYCVVEWGNIWSSLTPIKMLNFSDVDGARNILVTAVNKGRSYIMDQWVQPNNGNYMFAIGRISDFNVTLERSGMYICDVTITSPGESLVGINNYQTYINKTAQQPTAGSATSQDSELVTTFHDFFRLGGLYDKLITATQADPNSVGFVSKYHNDFSKNYKVPQTNPQTTPRFDGISTNVHDYFWVSWKFLTINLVHALYSLITPQTQNNNAPYEKINGQPAITTDLFQFMTFEEPPLPTTAAQANTQDWVGNNTYLRSTDPDTMLIMRQDVANDLNQEGVQSLADNGFFDSTPFGAAPVNAPAAPSSPYRGKLSQGVWLNHEMIREAFLGANTFTEGMRAILTKMNNATAGYWNLELIWDEEHGTYKVIDSNHLDFAKDQTFYMFNHGTQGECLNINLEAAFPKEAIAAISLYASYKDTSGQQPNTDTLFAQAPLIGQTSPFAVALNWTDLMDQTAADVNASFTQVPLVPLVPRHISPKKGNGAGDATDNRTIAKISDNRSSVGQSTMITFNSPAAGQSVGNLNIAPIPPFQADATLVNRDSPVPVPNPAVQSQVATSYQYNDMINAAATKNNVPPQLIKAVIQVESGFSPQSSRYEAGLGQSSAGLMQILPGTAAQFGFTGSQADLSDPATNINYGSAYLGSLYKQTGGDPAATLSAYNGGYRPSIGFGGPNQSSGFRCLAGRDSYGNCLAPPNNDLNPFVHIGQFANRRYVNNGMKWYNTFLQADGKPTVGPMISPNPSPNAVPTSTGDPTLDSEDQNNQAQQDSTQQTLADWQTRFGNIILYICEVNASGMLASITHDGFTQHRAGVPNSFVAPYPLSTRVDVELAGISGISAGDAFHVDKLPFVFEQNGMFRVIEIQDRVTPSTGWTTTVTGYFSLHYLDGDGMTNPGYTKAVAGPSDPSQATSIRRKT